MIPNPTLFHNYTGFTSYYNYLHTDEGDFDAYLGKLFSRTDLRAAIHVGNTTFGDVNVENNLMNDVMQSVSPWIVELLSHYRILFYNGQLDIIVAYPLTVNFLEHLEFDAAIQYKTAKRHIWTVDDDIAGYYKKAGNLTEVLVRNAGHMVPTDQPVWALDLITKFTRNHF